MKKRLLISFLFTVVLIWTCPAQNNKYYTKTGIIKFVSATPLLTLKAYHKNIVSFLDIQTGEVVFGVTMKGFKFRRPLAEEHFNENYAETDKYPNAKFNGKILNFEQLNFEDKMEYEVVVEGEMSIHGVTRQIKEKGRIYIKKDKILATSTFIILPEDYEIKIPGLVRDKIAKEVQIEVEVIYKLYEN